jgi:hypothetical protein
MAGDSGRSEMEAWLRRLLGLDPAAELPQVPPPPARPPRRPMVEWADQDYDEQTGPIFRRPEQSDESQKETAVAEGSWVPKTWEEWVTSTIWGVIILGFGLEFCAHVVRGDYGYALVALFFLAVVSAMLLHGKQARSWAMSISPNWTYVAALAALQIVLFLPFVEEKRWPFSAWLPPATAPAVIHDPPTDEDIAKATGPLRAELDSVKHQRDTAIQERDAARSPSSGPKSPILGLDDAKRFQLVKALRDATHTAQSTLATCHAMLHQKPQTKWAEQFWPEIAVVMSYAGWQLEGGRTAKTYFPAGVTLSAAKDAGDGFNCAFRLSELLLGLNVSTNLRANQITPDLIACEKENPTHGCVEMVMGDAH